MNAISGYQRRGRDRRPTAAPRRRFAVGAAWLVALSLFVHAAPAAASEASAERLERLLDETETLRAEFHQLTRDSATGRTLEEASGRVEIARPGRFRWEYEQPYEQLVVTDGERVWMYDIDLAQVSINRVDEALASSPAMLLGGGRLAEGFRVVEAWDEAGLEWVQLEPRIADSDFRSVTLAHDGRAVVHMELVDALGQETLIRFDDVQRDVELPEGRFVFEIPEGVDVIGDEAAR